MPFTPSHAVVALPFVRTPLVPAAVAIGAMTPDLPLFLRLTGDGYAAAHDLRMIPVTMIVALGLLLLWRLLLRPAARSLAPAWLASRLPGGWDAGARASLRETFPSVGGVLWLAAALAIGVASHILWDAFTHEGRAGLALLPGLEGPWGPLPGYKWLQYGSSVLGLLVLAIAGGVWLRGRPRAPVVRTVPDAVRIGWWLSLPAALLVGVVIGVLVYGMPDADFTVRHLAYRVLPAACAVWGALTLVLCAALVRRRSSQPRAAEGRRG